MPKLDANEADVLLDGSPPTAGPTPLRRREVLLVSGVRTEAPFANGSARGIRLAGTPLEGDEDRSLRVESPKPVAEGEAAIDERLPLAAAAARSRALRSPAELELLRRRRAAGESSVPPMLPEARVLADVTDETGDVGSGATCIGGNVAD